jgi:hypothetical protein
MLRWLAILAVVGVMAAVGIVTSQTTPPDTPEKGITTEGTGGVRGEQAKPQHNDTNSPQSTSVNVQTSTDTNQNEANTEQENLDIQRKLELFTGCLVLVGFLQVVTMFWQARLLRGTLNQIRVQAEAAKKSADAYVSAERGWVLASIRKTDLSFDTMKCEFVFNNYGRTPAIIESFSIDAKWPLPKPEFPLPPVYEKTTEARIILGPGEERVVGTFPADLPLELAISWGYVNYGGIFEGQRTTKFCFRYDREEDLFIPTGPPAYNDIT